MELRHISTPLHFSFFKDLLIAHVYEGHHQKMLSFSLDLIGGGLVSHHAFLLCRALYYSTIALMIDSN